MEDTIRKMYEDQIIETINSIQSFEQGSEERKAAIAELDRLNSMRINDFKAQVEADNQRLTRIQEQDKIDMELKLKEEQMARDEATAIAEAEERKKSRIGEWIKFGLTGAGTMVLFALGWKFEETGHISGSMSKLLMNKIKLGKR